MIGNKNNNLTIFVLVAAFALAACSEKAAVTATGGAISAESPVPSSFTQFPDVPSPQGAKIVVDRTLVLGGGENWIGQLVLHTGHGPYTMFDFLKLRLPEFGWSEITSVRAPTSVLTYSRMGRIGTFQIQGRTMQGSEIIVTVSPSESGSGAPTMR